MVWLVLNLPRENLAYTWYTSRKHIRSPSGSRGSRTVSKVTPLRRNVLSHDKLQELSRRTSHEGQLPIHERVGTCHQKNARASRANTIPSLRSLERNSQRDARPTRLRRNRTSLQETFVNTNHALNALHSGPTEDGSYVVGIIGSLAMLLSANRRAHVVAARNQYLAISVQPLHCFLHRHIYAKTTVPELPVR
jgi:hypothetical protein